MNVNAPPLKICATSLTAIETPTPSAGVSELPFWPQFVSSLHANNAWSAPRRLRVYQAVILDEARLTLVSPLTGHTVCAGNSLLLGNGDIAYGFGELIGWAVIASGMKSGFPLQTLVVARGAERIGIDAQAPPSLPPSPSPILSHQWPDLIAPATSEDSITAELVIGHTNFAHHLWNELPALDEWLSTRPLCNIRRLVVRARLEPLGPLQDLLTALRPATILREPASRAERSPRLLTRIGSTRITARTRRHVVDFLRQIGGDATTAIETAIEGSGPIFWLSVRPIADGRSCVNQEQFLTTLIIYLRTQYPDCAVLLDGFSLQTNCLGMPVFDSLLPTFSRRMIESQRIIDLVTEAAAAGLGCAAADTAISLSGLSLGEALHLAERADYYVCHAGTIQHKLGWVHNTPGFIHSCKAGISLGAQRWYADQLEDGIRPDVLDSNNVADIDPAPGDPVATRNVDYRIRDTGAAVEQVLACIRTRHPTGD